DVVGTFQYLPPEQMDSSRAVDARADLYSLGGTLFTALTGRPPFEGAGLEVLTQHLVATPTAPRTLVPEIPPELDRLLLAPLEKEAARRPASAAIAAEELEAIGRAGDARKAAGGRAVAVAVALGVVVVAAGVALTVSGPSARKEPSSRATSTAADA